MQETSGGSQGDGHQDGRNLIFSLVDQNVPQPPQERLSHPVQVGDNNYGQARYLQLIVHGENVDSDAASLPPQNIIQNNNTTNQGPLFVQQPSSAAQSLIMEPQISENIDVHIAEDYRHRLSISGRDDRHGDSLTSNLHGQSASGFSDPAMNQPSRGHLRSIQPLNDSLMESMIGSNYEQLKEKCLESFNGSPYCEKEAYCYAKQLLYYSNGILKCLKCKEAQDVGTNFVHRESCPVKSFQVTQDSRDQGSRCRGQVETNGISSNHDDGRNQRDQTPSFPPTIPQENRPVEGAVGGVASAGASSSGDTLVKTAHRHENSVHTGSRYGSIESRFQTFHNWKHGHVQSPASLADAGLYYTGKGDECKCHECRLILRRWEVGDIPWHEHARLSRYCPYVLKRKGQDFVDAVLRNESEQQFQTAPTSFQNTSAAGESLQGRRSNMSSRGISSNHDDERNQRDQTPSFPPTIPTTPLRLPGSPQVEQERRHVEGAVGGVSSAGASSLGDTSVKTVDKRDMCIKNLTEMGFDEGQIQRAIQEFTGADAMKVPSVEELLDLIMKQSDSNPSALMDPLVCCGCNKRSVACTQYECRHIVCAECAPSVLGGRCKVCGNKVVKVCAVDTSHLKKK